MNTTSSYDTVAYSLDATDVALSVKGLVGGYGPTTILHGTTFDVRRGAITTVIGPNGAGKSTCFKAIFGLLKLRQGTVMMEGADITGLNQAALLRQGVSYVPQGRNLFPQLTVKANLEFGGVPLKDLKATRKRMESVYERFPVLGTKSSQQAGTLSGGEQKMLEIGRALLLDPKVLLIDEPSIGLSPILVQQVFSTLQALRDSGVTILMIEQNAKQALAASDDGIVLQQGRLALQGKASSLLDHPDIARVFLGAHGQSQQESQRESQQESSVDG
jgi:branched-chain amino acid transport system ATP-binding protein